MDRKPVFDSFRTFMGGRLTQAEVDALGAFLDGFRPTVAASAWKPNQISERIQLEILEHEGIVPEAYKDSVGVWTWGAGVTNASGHKVARYKDNPTTVLRCLEVYEWLIRTKYLPDVLEAFKGYQLAEHELGAALSFHWNTGAINEAQWVKTFKAGNRAKAKLEIMNWSTPKEIIGRRQLERNLFFDGAWSSDGIVTVYEKVNRTSYQPIWSSAKQVDIRPMLRDVVARAGA